MRVDLTAASIFAGESTLGSVSMDKTWKQTVKSKDSECVGSIRAYAHADRKDIVNGQPTLRGLLLGIHRVFPRRMQNRNTNFSIRPNVGVKYRGDKTHDGRIVRIRMRELEGGLKNAALVQRTFGAHYAH